MTAEPGVDHRVRNGLAGLRGYLELAHEAATGHAGRPEDVVRDLGDALACLTKLEYALGVNADDGTPTHGDPVSEEAGPQDGAGSTQKSLPDGSS